METLISSRRHTTRPASLGKRYDDFVELTVKSNPSSSNGMAYWVQGKSVPVLEIRGIEDVLLAARKQRFGEAEQIIVEGPFGPNFKILLWLWDRLVQERKGQHPVQVPKADSLCLVADQTGLARCVSLWAWHGKSRGSIPLLIRSSAPKMLKELFEEGEESETTLERGLSDLCQESLIIVCGTPEFQRYIEDKAAPCPTVDR